MVPKMDGLFHGKPYEQMYDLGGKTPYFWFNTQQQKKTPLCSNPFWKWFGSGFWVPKHLLTGSLEH